jgi:[acyl-carrier-protein] S-malonyltransferase
VIRDSWVLPEPRTTRTTNHEILYMTRSAFLFPGQGAQTVGMAKKLVETNREAERLFSEAEKILGYNLLRLCVNGPKERLDATDISQPAIFVTSLAALEVLKSTEPEALPDCVATAGLSLGEYTALVFSGSISFENGLQLVQKRGRAMQDAAEVTPSGMVSILLLDIPQVEELVQQAQSAGMIQIANYLCPGNTVVSGAKAACDRIIELAENKNAKTIRIAVAGAFHTTIMKPADERLREALSNVPIQPPQVPVWSNVDAKSHHEPNEIRELLVQQVLSPVQWEQTIRNLLETGIDRFYEIGPGRVLAGLLKRINRKTECRNISADP